MPYRSNHYVWSRSRSVWGIVDMPTPAVLPASLRNVIEEANSSNAEITDINITENGNYVIILGGSGYWTLGYPDAFLKKLEQYRTGDLRDDNILSACFNDRGEWVVITDKHYSYSNETTKNSY